MLEAAGRGYYDCMVALMRAGANIHHSDSVRGRILRISIIKFVHDCCLKDGRTAVIEAAYNGHFDCLQELVLAGAKLEDPDSTVSE